MSPRNDSQRPNSKRPVNRRLDTVLTRPIARRPRAGDLTGFAAGTPILTLDGELPVEHLTAGDRVITRSGARIVKSISSRLVKGAFAIRPHTLGHDRPDCTMTVGPRQEILLRDWRAKALYNKTQAQVPVARLVDGEYITATEGAVRLFRLEFVQDEVIYAGGLEAAVRASPV